MVPIILTVTGWLLEERDAIATNPQKTDRPKKIEASVDKPLGSIAVKKKPAEQTKAMAAMIIREPALNDLRSLVFNRLSTQLFT